MTDFSLAFHPEAEVDLLEAVEWYAERNPNAAIAFQTAIERSGQLILRSPHTWPVYIYGTQKHTVRLFPFTIIYRVVDADIQVIAVAHDRRRPRYWAHRLG